MSVLSLHQASRTILTGQNEYNRPGQYVPVILNHRKSGRGTADMKKYQISIPDTMDSQILAAHKQGKFSALLPSQFIKYLITVGLSEFQVEIKRDHARREAIKQAAGCETAPQAIQPEQRPGGKILPFPGVSIVSDFQNSIDGFLREIGYIE